MALSVIAMRHKESILAALGAALIFVTTMFIKIPSAYGYFNLGDALIFLFASALSPFTAFLCGGIGSALADISGCYMQYAVFTLFIKGIEGLLVAVLYQRLHVRPLFSIMAAALWMLIGYFLCDWFLYQQAEAAAAGLLMNAAQGLFGIIIAAILHPRFMNIVKHFNLKKKENR